MADVRPFRGLRYNQSFASHLDDVLAPPFDVVSAEEQKALHDRSPHNVIRIELGETQAADTDADNRYTRARDLLQRWLAEGALQQDDRPAFYLSRHTFRHDGQERSRWELYTQVRLEEWDKKVVLPHEFTLPGAKSDRLNLLRATRTNVSPVYSLYPDAGGSLGGLLQAQAQGQPVAQVSGWKDTAFTVWAITDPAVVGQIIAALQDTRLYIADGHHRYETALNYRNERRAQGGGDADEGYNFVLMALTAVDDPGLLVLPIHRLVRGLDAGRIQTLLTKLNQEWRLEHLPLRPARVAEDLPAVLRALDGAAEEPAFAIYGLEWGSAILARPKSVADLRSRLPQSMAEPLKQLDLSVLHEVVLHGYLGIGREPADVERALTFTHLAAEAVAAVESGNAQLAILVNPTRVQQMVDVADAGEKMPQKSTFFFPKLPTGLVLRPVEEAVFA